MPLISVIVPTFNCGQFLQTAIDSVFAQTLVDYEVIIVDDGSTDYTPELANEYRSDRRIHYIRQENSGLPAARNAGVAVSQGEFIAALDADDALDPTALEEMAEALLGSGASWCLSDIIRFWENEGRIQKTELPALDDLWLGILRTDFIRRGMFLRRTALDRIGMWDPWMKMREDWDLNIRLISAREPFVYLPRPLYHYRKRPASITTGDPTRLFRYTEQLLKKHHKRLADAGCRDVAKIYAANMWQLGRDHFHRRRSLQDAFRCVRESLAYDVSFPRLVHPVVHHLGISAR